jgi:hypothetical protein
LEVDLAATTESAGKAAAAAAVPEDPKVKKEKNAKGDGEGKGKKRARKQAKRVAAAKDRTEAALDILEADLPDAATPVKAARKRLAKDT